MKGTQGVGELGQNLSLGPQTNPQRIDKTITHSGASSALANKGMAIAVLGSRLLSYGLVLVVGLIGLVKFTGYEANGIQPLVAHNPFMEWMFILLCLQYISTYLCNVIIILALVLSSQPA